MDKSENSSNDPVSRKGLSAKGTFCIALVLGVIAVFLSFNTLTLIIQGQKAEGVVTQAVCRDGGKGSVSCNLYIDYLAQDGNQHTVNITTFISYSTGEKVSILYNPNNINQVVITSSGSLLRTVIIFFILPFIFLLVGLGKAFL